MATIADYQALAAHVSAEQVNLSVAVESAKAQLPPSSLDAWYDLARRCVAFTGHAGPYDAWDDLVLEGTGLSAELAAWRATLTAMGVDVPTLASRPAPPPPPPYIPYVSPGQVAPGHTFFDQVGDVLPFVLAFLVIREWNEARR